MVIVLCEFSWGIFFKRKSLKYHWLDPKIFVSDCGIHRHELIVVINLQPDSLTCHVHEQSRFP
jgi:hypothetical protein